MKNTASIQFSSDHQHFGVSQITGLLIKTRNITCFKPITRKGSEIKNFVEQ